MNWKGGYQILLKGRPSGEVGVLPETDELFLPLRSRRFHFSDVCVTENQQVHPGTVLAKDPGNYSIPLLAPRAGKVRLSEAPGHIVLRNIAKETEEPYEPKEDLEHVPRNLDSAGMKRYKLVALGAWQFFHDARTGALPDPFAVPKAVIVSSVAFERYVSRGDVQILKRLNSFVRGLEQLQALLEYQPIYLVMPDIKSKFARKVHETLRGYAWVHLVEIPLRYPFDNFAVLASRLGLDRKPTAAPPGEKPISVSGELPPSPEPSDVVWGVPVGGVLAVDRALTMSKPCTVRLISLGGPEVASPMHLKAIPGYPVKKILRGRVSEGELRVINGGALTGKALTGETLGLDVECEGLTVLAEPKTREFLGWLRPGWDRRSYSRCFLSTLRPPFPEAHTTALRGELRACISCNFCEEVCPSGIMPHLIHKYLYRDALEEAERAGVNRCVDCGLCSFVCPSKIELHLQILEARERLRTEIHGQEAVQ